MEDDSHAGPSPYRWPLALQQQRAPVRLLLVLLLVTHVSSSIAQLNTATPALVTTAARDIQAETAAVAHANSAADQQQHSGGSTYSALCVVAKDENRYIAEWVQYHKCLGVGRIYLYDHQSRKPMSDEIQSYIQEGFVKYIPFEGNHVRWEKDVFADNLTKFSATIQGSAYKDCLQCFSAHHQFIGFIDVDEFIVFHDQSIASIDELLKRFEPFAGVSFYWIMFGSSGYKQSPQGWVTRSYLKCLPRKRGQNTQFKSFVNTAYQPTMYSPHRAMFAVKEPNSYLVDENFRRIPSGRNKNSTHGLAAIYHYATKSQQEFNVKRMRGGGAGVTRPAHFLKRLDQACTEWCFGASLLYARLCGA